MNPQGPNGWRPGSGPGPASSSSDHTQQQQRLPGSFGPNLPGQPTSQSQMSGPSLLQQTTPFYSNQSNGQNPPNSSSLPPAPPMQPTRGPAPPQPHQQSPPGMHQRPVQAPAYTLPNLGPTIQQQQSPQGHSIDAEREIEQARLRGQQAREQAEMQAQQQLAAQERHLLQQQQQQYRLQQEQQQRFKEQELIQQQQQLEQQQREQQHRERMEVDRVSSPRENHIGAAIPIQQPVASRVPATLHGPNGILSDQHPAGVPPASQSSQSIGAQSGPNTQFGNGVQAANENGPRSFAQHVAQSLPPQQLLGIGNSSTPQQPQNGALSQGQQPILNDALSYLDQVKVRFQHEPDVYNRFLDIMKDFKSQAIDTPGVIDRVSHLFTGHPELIQGFNTFLPPGYRIECGTEGDPNSIRVTTPMGTTVQRLDQSGHDHRLNGSGPESGKQFYGDSPANGEWGPQRHDMEPVSERPFPGVAASYITMEDRLQQEHADRGLVSDLVHQQEQRGISHLASAASTNGGQAQLVAAQVSPGEGAGQAFGPTGAGFSNAALNASSQLGMEKRGPVEFNHAIGYVNKIKNRFATQPEIYKQFLEVLQTYQRESKPIQDVYAQVTQLFSSAPDLLEDFKQFLPESAAQAKAQAQAAAKQQMEDATVLSNVRGDNGYVSHPQAQTPKGEPKMPPVGNFAPPSVGKDSKKRRGGPGAQITGGAAAIDSVSGPSGQNNRNRAGNAQKRPRVEPTRPVAPEAPLLSPTLVPALPTPMPPSREVTGVHDPIQFFDRVKKYISNRSTFNEFLKLCNLFTQELIDKNTLMNKAYAFLGGSAELTTWFKNWIKFDGHDEVIENKPRIPGDKVVLSNCRSYGPSYRLLPKRERLRGCRGRDEVCHQVLNDTWVSHPTWASEDSGFIAHRKNQYEEALHRIEEERHDYDINIEACLRTIQLMEPIAQQFQMMSEKDRFEYELPNGMGGQSETIYQRVIKKIYDRERGRKVIEDMKRRPSAVLPVVLARLKQKVEEWKASQREWEKVWREQTNRIFWKSLDHQGILAKQNDKRQFQPKALHNEIVMRYDEQRRDKVHRPWGKHPKYQFEYNFEDTDVIYDACHLMLTHLQTAAVYNDGDKSRLESFIKTFIPAFFDLDRHKFDVKMSDIYESTPPNEEVEEEGAVEADTNTARGRRGNAKKANLLRGVLERGKPGQKDDIESKESTPDVQSAGEETPASAGTPAEQVPADTREHLWLSHPTTGNKTADLNTPFKRNDFHLYATLNIYCFFRMFELLYERLSMIKQNEDQVHRDVDRLTIVKPADHLGINDKKPRDFFEEVGPSANYYHQILTMLEDVLRHNVENAHLEETLRRFYMKSGWQLYQFDKMLPAILRFAIQILISDNKDKSLDIINLFYKDRNNDETTHQTELTYRKQVEKLAKDSDIYRIRFNRVTKTAQAKIFKKDERTYELDELADTARWSYYVSAFSMWDQTEGIDLRKLNYPLLHRNLPSQMDTDEEYTSAYSPAFHADGLVIRISPNNYHLLYDPATSDWFLHGAKQQKKGLTGYDEIKRNRKEGLKALVNDKEKNTWLRDATEAQAETTITEFGRWINEGPEGTRHKSAGASATEGTVDQVMGGT